MSNPTLFPSSSPSLLHVYAYIDKRKLTQTIKVCAKFTARTSENLSRYPNFLVSSTKTKNRSVFHIHKLAIYLLETGYWKAHLTISTTTDVLVLMRRTIAQILPRANVGRLLLLSPPYSFFLLLLRLLHQQPQRHQSGVL
jgi:hypothetical protein